MTFIHCKFHQLLASLVVMLTLSATVCAHPGVINVYVNPTTNQLFPFEPFEPANLALFVGLEISAPFPGFGISFPANGVEVGETLEFRTTLGLLYWDGNDVAPTDYTLTVDAPTFDSGGTPISNTFPNYQISHTAINQSGMTWGTYSGENFWEADGLYLLDPLDAPAGIYGIAAQLDSPSHEISRPFIFPFVFDPNSEFDDATKTAGVTRLRQLVHADINDDGVLDGADIDALVLDVAAGTDTEKMDLTLDGLVNGDDLAVWLEVAGRHNLGRSYLPGDANLDGTVDGADFLVWNGNKFSPSSGWTGADFTADGTVDGADFLAWNNFKFSSADVHTAVPEPGLGLMGAILAVLFQRFACRRHDSV